MREAGKVLKEAVTTLLDGHLTAETIGVPLFDGKVEGEVNTYVLMGISNETNEEDTMSMSVTKMNLDFDIVNIRKATSKSEILELVSDQIRVLINPAKNTEGFTLSSPFFLSYCQFLSATEDSVSKTDGNKFMHTKRITFQTVIAIN